MENSQITKIKSTSQKVELISRIILWGMPIAFVIAVIVMMIGGNPDFNLTISNHSLPLSDVSTSMKILAMFAAFIGIAIFEKGIYHINRLFKEYTKGNIFTATTVKQIKNLGITLIICGISSVLINTLNSVVIASVDTDYTFVINILTNEFFSLTFIGIIVLVAARIMDIAKSLKADSDLTI